MERPANRDEYLQLIKSWLPENPTVLEIGVEAGHLSTKILETLDPAELHLLDPWETNPGNGKIYSEGHMNNVPTAHSNVGMQIAIERKFSGEIKDGVVHIHRGYSSDLVDKFEEGYFDFVYIDGCHLYDSVKEDLNNYLPKVQNQGILGGHDYISKEVKFEQQGVVYSNQLGYGIKQAVDELLEERKDLELVAVVSDDWPFPDWAIRRIS